MQSGSHGASGFKLSDPTAPAKKTDKSTSGSLEALLASTGATEPGYMAKPKAAPDMSFPSLECPSTMPDLSQHTSLLAKALTEDPSLYETYKGMATGSGVTFAQCIKPGLENKAAGVGLVAGDEDSYTAFSGVFDAVIAARHKGYSSDASHTTTMDPSGISGDVVDSTGKYVLSTRVRSGRNIRGFSLAPAIDVDDRRTVERIVSTAVSGLAGDLKGEYLPLLGSTSVEGFPEGMSCDQEDALRADGVLFEEPSSAVLVSGGVHKDWPDARGVFSNAAKTFLVWANEEDHARIISMATGGDIKSVFSTFFAGVAGLQNGVQDQGYDFMSNGHLGYISADPSNLGTALRASVMMKIPKFGAHPDFQTTLNELGLAGVGNGSTFEISTTDVLGITEVELANKLIKGVATIIGKEIVLEQGLPMELAAVMAVKANNPDNICAQVFDPEYYGTLSDADKADLLACCNSGIENPDSGMGCYACQPADYDRFKPFFSKAL
eukprot:COSAG02_NODE_2944_length_7689_cov_9.378920_1_plen_493_part_10